MNRTTTLPIAFALLTSFFAGWLHAADSVSPAEARMRDALRSTMLQLREAQNQAATLQAAQAEWEQKNKALGSELDALKKKSKADAAAAEKETAELKATLEKKQNQIDDLNVSVGKWEDAHRKISNLASTTEAERARLAAEVIVLRRRIADQQTKNDAMFKIANEILVRYEKFGLGTALTAREPFVGITRVKLENLVQDYQDKIAEQKIKP